MEKPTPGEVWPVQRQMTQEPWVLALAPQRSSSEHWPGRFPSLGLSFLACQMGGWARRAQCQISEPRAGCGLQQGPRPPSASVPSPVTC